MGKIFTYRDVKDGNVPSISDFVRAKEQLLMVLQRCVRSDKVFGAAIFGSVAKGTQNERSDIDVVVITSSESRNDALLDAILKIHADLHIDVEPIVIPKEFAENGFHSIDASFFNHLQRTVTSENTVGRNPLEILKFQGGSRVETHKKYLIQKLRQLRAGIYKRSQADLYKALQRALESPMNTGRRTLEALQELAVISDLLEDDGKKEVIHVFKSVFSSTNIGKGFTDLVRADQDYTRLLRQAIDGKVTQEEYNKQVQNFISTYIPRAVSWIEEVSLNFTAEVEKAGLDSDIYS